MQRAEEEGLKSIRNKRKDAEGTTHIARKKVLRVRGKDFSIKRAWKKIGLDFFGFFFFWISFFFLDLQDFQVSSQTFLCFYFLKSGHQILFALSKQNNLKILAYWE